MSAAAYTAHIQETQLIKSSLLPGSETFQFQLSQWQTLFDEFEDNGEISVFPDLLPPPNFVINLDLAQICIDVEFSSSSSFPNGASVSIKGDISKNKQMEWMRFIHNKSAELVGSENPTFELLSSYVLPLLHSEVKGKGVSVAQVETTPLTPVVVVFHALLTSHHLISPNKRRSLQQWSSSLSIAGFAKVGYPGVIYAQGSEESVHEFVHNIKSMQWLALKVRFIEPLESGVTVEPRRWLEFQKVGEVVERMRLIGCEKYVVEMGIGSAGIKVTN